MSNAQVNSGKYFNGIEVEESSHEGTFYDRVLKFLYFKDVTLTTSRFFLLIASLLIGTNFVFIKILVTALSPSVAVALRFTLGAIALSPLLFPCDSQYFLIGIQLGSQIFLAVFCESIALQTVLASTASFIGSLCGIVPPVVDLFFSNPNMKRSGVYCYLILPPIFAALGVMLFVSFGSENLTGTNCLILFPFLLCGISFWRMEKFLRSIEKPDALKVTTYVIMTTAILSLMWVIIDHLITLCRFGSVIGIHRFQREVDGLGNVGVIGSLLWSGLLSTSLAYALYDKSMTVLPASEAAIMCSTEPLWATSLSVLLLGEKLTWNMIVGAIIIILACLWSSLNRKILVANTV